MTGTAADIVTSALRRALPLIIVLVLLGIVTVNAKQQLDGPRYAATSQVYLANTDLGAVLAGVQPSYVDPRRIMENALSLARSPQLYARAAEETPLTPGQVRQMVTVEGRENADVIAFTATGEDRELVIEVANAVASEYPRWRAEVSVVAVRQAVERLRQEVEDAEDPTLLEEQLQRLELMESLSTGNAMLLEPAGGAAQLSPAPVRASLLGAAIGLVMALLIAGAREVLDTRIRTEAEAEESLEAPIVATIPSLPKRARLVTVGRYEERFGDAYALLAANLMQLKEEGEPLTVAVTSATKQEGKSITAANLAVALARRGERVVLADFDSRRPTVASTFRLPTVAPGVVQAMRHDVAVSELMQTVRLNGDGRLGVSRRGVVSSSVKRLRGASPALSEEVGGTLRVLPAGGSVSGALAYAPRAKAVLASLADGADLVLVDTPPALSTPEMAELSKLVDAVLVVVRHGRATRRSLQTLRRQASRWQAPIAGIVITDASSEEAYSYYAPR